MIFFFTKRCVTDIQAITKKMEKSRKRENEMLGPSGPPYVLKC